MEMFNSICIAIITMYVLTEPVAAIYIARNWNVFKPRLRFLIKELMPEQGNQMDEDQYRRLMKNVRFIRRHVQFERAKLKEMGVLTKPDRSEQDNSEGHCACSRCECTDAEEVASNAGADAQDAFDNDYRY